MSEIEVTYNIEIDARTTRVIRNLETLEDLEYHYLDSVGYEVQATARFLADIKRGGERKYLTEALSKNFPDLAEKVADILLDQIEVKEVSQ